MNQKNIFNNYNWILIDTNALMLPGQFHIDIFRELNKLGYINFLVLESVVLELKNIINKNKTHKKAAKIALKLVQKCNVINCFGYADNLIFDISIKNKLSVFTNDQELKHRLMNSNICVVYLRQKTYLEKTI